MTGHHSTSVFAMLSQWRSNSEQHDRETDVTFLVYCLAKKALLLHISELEILLTGFQVTNPRVSLDGEEVIISISYFPMLLLCIVLYLGEL